MILRNKYHLIVLFLGLSISCFSQSITKVYKLKSVTKNADFDYEQLQNFDALQDVEKAFKPMIEGDYKVFTFIATFKGLDIWFPPEVDKDGNRILTKQEEEKRNRKKTFHDILIVKTNLKNEIIDAYQYTLEWAEPQLSYDLFRSTNKNQKLTNGLSIEKLKFYSTQIDRKKEPLEEKGIVRLK